MTRIDDVMQQAKETYLWAIEHNQAAGNLYFWDKVLVPPLAFAIAEALDADVEIVGPFGLSCHTHLKVTDKRSGARIGYVFVCPGDLDKAELHTYNPNHETTYPDGTIGFLNHMDAPESPLPETIWDLIKGDPALQQRWIEVNITAEPMDRNNEIVGYGDVLRDNQGNDWRIEQAGNKRVTVQSLNTWHYQTVDYSDIAQMTRQKRNIYSRSLGWRYNRFGPECQ